MLEFNIGFALVGDGICAYNQWPLSVCGLRRSIVGVYVDNIVLADMCSRLVVEH